MIMIKPPTKLHEDSEDSCRVLCSLIAKEPREKQQMLLCDLSTKIRPVRPEARSYFIAQGLINFVPDEIKSIFKDQIMSPDIKPKQRADIAFVTIKTPELLAAKVALDIPPNRKEDNLVSGYRYFETRLDSKGMERELTVVLTMVGRDRNVPCTNAVRTLLETYDVGVCALVGIAAGLRAKFKLGDVVVAESVWDYEGARFGKGGPKNRPEVRNLFREIGRDLQYFDPSQTGWEEEFFQSLKELSSYTDIPQVVPEWHPEFYQGIVLAGEKLIADGGLEYLRAEYHERVRVLEMEASGFAQACEEGGIPWLVLRGISDFGDPESKDEVESTDVDRKIWQATSALSASTVAVNFFQHEYREVKERDF